MMYKHDVAVKAVPHLTSHHINPTKRFTTHASSFFSLRKGGRRPQIYPPGWFPIPIRGLMMVSFLVDG